MIGTIAAAVCVAALLGLGIWVHLESQHYGRLITTVVGQQATIRTALRAHGIDVDGDADAATDELPAVNVANLPRRPRGTAPRHAAKETA